MTTFLWRLGLKKLNRLFAFLLSAADIGVRDNVCGVFGSSLFCMEDGKADCGLTHGAFPIGFSCGRKRQSERRAFAFGAFDFYRSGVFLDDSV